MELCVVCKLKHEVSDFEFHMIGKFMNSRKLSFMRVLAEVNGITLKSKLIRRVEDNQKICEAFI